MRACMLLFGILLGCGPSLSQATRDAQSFNVETEQKLTRRIADAGTPLTLGTVQIRIAGGTPDPHAPSGAPPSTAPLATPAATAGALGLVEGEKLYRVGDELAFVGGVCVATATCESSCVRSAEYRYARATDGRVVILRLRPIFDTVRVKVPDCGDECGGNPPGPEPHPPAIVTGVLLKARALDQVAVRDVAYPVRLVRAWCSHPEPRP